MSFLALLLFGSFKAGMVFLLVAVWLVLGISIIKENERAVAVLLGAPYKALESGPRWIPLFIGKIVRYPSGKVPLEMPTFAGIVTKAGRYEGEDFGPANVKAQVVVYFNYPIGDELLKAVKQLPPPEDKAAMIDLFEEPLLEVVRNEGGKQTWFQLSRERSRFSNLITEAINDGSTPSGINRLVNETGLVDVEVSVKHLDVPESILLKLDDQEEARLERAGIKIRAEAERDRLKVVGEGIANAKKQLIDVLTEKPENVQAQALLTLIEMAQGPATTIFPISTNLTDVLSNITGRSMGSSEQIAQAFHALPKDVREKLINSMKPTTEGVR